MKIFLGIGAGPIQTGIFVSGAAKNKFDRIILADVDTELVAAISQVKSITVNTAQDTTIQTDTYENIEILNPLVDKEQLIELAANADVISTALPSTKFYSNLTWLKDAFSTHEDKTRYIYAAENSTTAAAELKAFLGEYANTHYLDTVIGKMSKIFTTQECDLPALATGFSRGHLVEAFNTIYTSSAPGIEDMALDGLYPKEDLEPFEEAKLYGHNATHFLLGKLAFAKGCTYMNEATRYPEIMRLARQALRDECGVALCRKYSEVDPFFTAAEFNIYADNLLSRMVSPILQDNVERIIRDAERKYSWNDRIIGALRLCISQDVYPSALTSCVELTKQLSEKWKTENCYHTQEASAVNFAIREQQRYKFSYEAHNHYNNYIADMDQIAYARMSTLNEGDGRGNRIIEVNNGSGLSFTVVPDRAMDIVEASFRGIPISFRAPSGHVNPGRFVENGFDWLRFWAGGLLTTCGLRHVGAPEVESESSISSQHGLHGRISSQSAEDVGIIRQWNNNRYEITTKGTLRQAMMFGENLRLNRSISTALGDNAIYIKDQVVNLGTSPEYIQILYHCNFGYPAISPGTRLTAVEHSLCPRNEDAVSEMHCWNEFSEPGIGIKEQCYLHTIPATDCNWATMEIINEQLGIGISVSYDTATLPNLMQWKLPERGRYVLGLEPTNTTVSGRSKDIASGVAPTLASAESIEFNFKIVFSSI